MNFLENITFRSSRTRSEPNNDDSDIISQTLDCSTSNNVTDMSEDEDDQITILKAEIGQLKAQLNSARSEIELLSQENKNLKRINEDLLKQNDIPNHDLKKTQTPEKNANNNNCTKHTRTLQSMRKDYKHASSPTTHDFRTEDKSENINTCLSSTNQDGISQTNLNISSLKHKICLISSETSNRMYKITERTKLCNFEICHYRKPNCSLNCLLDNIDKKVRSFTYFDYCIIYIGELFFRKTHNYIELVSSIREKLITLNHTNFIICLPTFKYMVNSNIMYNSRIETFNNLLCMDVETYKYAYILDSNFNLPYTSDTYSRYGTLNNKGLNIVISDLQDLVLEIGALNTAQLEIQNQCQKECSTDPQLLNPQFFR